MRDNGSHSRWGGPPGEANRWGAILCRTGVLAVLSALLLLTTLRSSWGDGQGIALEYWHIYGADLGRAHEQLLEEFNATNLGIQVRYSYSGNPWTGWDKLLLAVATGTAPDVALIEDYWAARLAESGAILKLDHFVEEEGGEFADDIYPLFWGSGTYRGGVWAMPYAVSNLVLYYNKDLFREAGLEPGEPPRTWDELAQLGSRLTGDFDGDGRIDRWGLSFPLTAHKGVVYYWIPFLWQNGGELFSADGTEVLFASRQGVGALQFWQDLIYENGAMSISPPTEGFSAGRVAMTLGSSAKLRHYESQGGFELGVAPLPLQRRRATISGGKALAIFTDSAPKQEAAWKFIKWMTAAEQNLKWSTATGYIPLRLSVLGSAQFQGYLRENPGAEVAVEQLDYTRPRPIIVFYTEISRIIGLAIEGALFGREDPGKVLQEAAAEAERYLNP